MYCQTCKRESFVLSGTGRIGGKPALCGFCGFRFDKIYRDINQQLKFIADEDLTQAEKNILEILSEAGFKE